MANAATSLQVDNLACQNATVGTALRVTGFTDTSAAPGDATANTARGVSAFLTGAPAATITNNLVTANALVLATLQTIDGTLTQILTVVPGSGSFVITGNANASGTTKFGWLVIPV